MSENERRHGGPVRQFNRLVTQRVGALEEHYLTRSRPSARHGCSGRSVTGAATCARFGPGSKLDSGYLSRLLRSLESAGLVNVGLNESDRRVRTARLYAGRRGRAA